jgi:two-component system LytT family response regulator
MIRAFVVDDEPLARERIETQLERFPQITLAGSYGDALEALAAVEAQRPELLFLDVQMPGLDGFSFLEALDASRPLPAIVFVTAHERFALRAFEVHAIDFLLKPFGAERFDRAVAHALAHLRAPNRDARVETMLRTLRGERRLDERIAAWYRGALQLIRIEDVDWFEADGNYVRLHAADTVFTVRSTLRRIEERLDPARFKRAHRSSILNLDRVVRLEPSFHGEFVAVLRGGARVAVSRSYSAWVRELA